MMVVVVIIMVLLLLFLLLDDHMLRKYNKKQRESVKIHLLERLWLSNLSRRKYITEYFKANEYKRIGIIG